MYVAKCSSHLNLLPGGSVKDKDSPLSDAESQMVADAIVAFSAFMFGCGPDMTVDYLVNMTQRARREYLERCEDVIAVWRLAIAKPDPTPDD